MAECLLCKQAFPESQLLVTAGGSVCQTCAAQKANEGTQSKGVWLTIFSGPGTAIGAMGGLCLGPLGPFVGGLLALAALGAGFRSIWCGWTYSHPEQYEVDIKPSSMEIGLLYASGVITIPWAASILGVALLAFVGLVASFA